MVVVFSYSLLQDYGVNNKRYFKKYYDGLK